MSKQKLAEAIETLMFSWGGDTPPEAFWVLQELVDFINAEYNQQLVAPTEEDYGTEMFNTKFEAITSFLKS
jgi:hypothetical protein